MHRFVYAMLFLFNELNIVTYIYLQVSASQLYGADEITQRQLRLLSGGKLKTEYLNEHYPPLLTSVKNVKMVYPHVKQSLNTEWVGPVVSFRT